MTSPVPVALGRAIDLLEQELDAYGHETGAFTVPPSAVGPILRAAVKVIELRKDLDKTS